jgi:hypothetical protein
MSNALARRFKVDVSVDNTTWIPLKGLTDFNPQENATLQEANDYDSNGFGSFEKTLTGVKVAIKARRVLNAGAFDPGQELARATWLQFGTSARLYMRFYDRNGASQAFSGQWLVDYQQSKTGVADIEEVGITFTADGQVSPITNPAGAAAVPAIATATPSGAATGALVTITGANFTGVVATTGVKFGGVNATNWSVVSDSTIVATMPTGSAGSAAIVITNAAGASNSFAYTRG